MFYIKFDERTVQAHATIMSQFCNVLWRIQNMYEEGIINEQVTVDVYVPEWYEQCYIGPNHQYHSMEQLEWFMNNFEQPSCGVNWQVHIYTDKTNTTSPWNTNCIWPLNKLWQWVGDGDYITVQKYNEVADPTRFNYNRLKAERSKQLDVIDNIEQYTDKKVVYIDYSMKQDDFFGLMQRSIKHYTYVGGSYYSAALINCPTICYGDPIGSVFPDSLNGNGMPGSVWGSAVGNGFSTICQYDFDRTYNGPQTYVTHAQTPEQLKGFLLELE